MLGKYKTTRARYREKHREEINTRARAYYAEHSEERKAYVANRKQRLKNEIFDKLGGKCTECGFGDRRALVIDHIGGGGRQHRKNKRGNRYYVEILEDLTPYQLLCANCNRIKAFENREFGNTVEIRRK